MRTWIRHHFYAMHIAIRRLLSTPFSSLTNIVVIALVLALPLLASSILVSMEPVARNVSVNPAITLFMKGDVPLDETREVGEKLQQENSAYIEKLEVVDKNEALAGLRASESWSNALKVLPRNPLPNSIIVTIKDVDDQAGKAQELAQAWSQLDNVDTVQFDSAWVQKLDAILSFTRGVLLLLAIGVAVVVVGTVFNTVRMQALVQREEIAVARLVGATESFVRRPFLYLGALTGMAAGVLSILLTTFGLGSLNGAIARLSESYGTDFVIRLPDVTWLLTAIVLVMLVAALAAQWSMTRHSRF